MGRIKNAILDKQQEIEDDLSELHQQLSNKQSELINFELQQYLDTFRIDLDFIKHRLDILEERNNEKNIQFSIIEKNKDKNVSTRFISLLSIFAALAAVYYKLRR